MTVVGTDITGKTPRSIIDLGVAYVPENRTEDASIADFRLDENLILKDFDKAPICGMLGSSIPTLLNTKEITSRAEQAINQFGIRATGDLRESPLAFWWEPAAPHLGKRTLWKSQTYCGFAANSRLGCCCNRICQKHTDSAEKPWSGSASCR